MTLFAAILSPPVRTMRAGLERKYRVSVEQEAGDRYAYRLRARVVVPSDPKGAVPKAPSVELHLELRLTDYKAILEEHEVRASFLGGGEMEVDPTGLPHGLDVTGPLGPVWMPVLSFYRPIEEGPFMVPALPVGAGLELSGKGDFATKDAKPTITLDTQLIAGGKGFGKLALTTRLDGEGWPVSSEGTFVSVDGTYRIRLQRG